MKNDHFSKIVNEQIQNIALEIQSKMKADLTINNQDAAMAQVEQRQQALDNQPAHMRSEQAVGMSTNASQLGENNQPQTENANTFAHDQTASTENVANTPNFNDNSVSN